MEDLKYSIYWYEDGEHRRVWTVLATDGAGEDNDLNPSRNAHGGCRPLYTVRAIRGFVRELHEAGAFDAGTRDALLAEVAAQSQEADRQEMKAIRERAGMSADDFARELGVTVDAVRSWESGRRAVSEPVLKLARRIAAERKTA